MSDQDVFYGTLASWWPLISPVEEYAEEAQWVGKLLARAARDVREVLELGSGGGHCAHHLNGRFAMTLVDRSASMLAVSQALNPGCRHVVGDMRTLRLAERFDAVFIYDAVDYLISEAELSEAFATARAHCRPGGVVVVIPITCARPSSPARASAAATRRTVAGRACSSGATTRIPTTTSSPRTTRSC